MYAHYIRPKSWPNLISSLRSTDLWNQENMLLLVMYGHALPVEMAELRREREDEAKTVELFTMASNLRKSLA